MYINYNSTNQNGLLKFVGPYRTLTTDQSIAGRVLPKFEPLSATFVLNNIIVVGEEAQPEEVQEQVPDVNEGETTKYNAIVSAAVIVGNPYNYMW